MSSDTISIPFTIMDCSLPHARSFWATILGHSNIPFTIRADRMDLEDFIDSMPDSTHYVTPRQYLSSLGGEGWIRFAYQFLNHLMAREVSKGDELRLRQAVMGRIMEIIADDAGAPCTEHYAHAGFKIAGHTINLFARQVAEGPNYTNEWGGYRVWIESESITDLDSLLSVYADIAINNALRSCQS